MYDSASVMQIFGCLMQHPQYLSENDKYQLSIDDFSMRLDRFIFAAIDNLYQNGAQRINPIDIENALSGNQTANALFNQQNGIEYLQDADELSNYLNFSYYYKRLKKFNLLSAFNKKGIDTSDIYVENQLVLTPEQEKINNKFDELEINEIVDIVKRKILGVERQYIQNDTSEVADVSIGLDELLEGFKEQADIGYAVQGEIFNEIISGARKGTLVIRSAASGTGKTRNAVGDACYLAFPFRYDRTKHEWIRTGSAKRVLFIATEQNFQEIQKMILAYLTDISESQFRYGQFSEEEENVLHQALWILKTYHENFFIVRMPNPTVELMKSLVRENVLMHEIEYVFYDYIQISPSLINEYRGLDLRNDELLLIFATTLKDLAVELNIFVMTSTQVNAKGDDNKNIRNESAIAGSRAIINKADIGCMMARPTREELEFFATQTSLGTPNLVTDIYKVRSGAWNQVRIWSDVNLGTLRKTDLFVTNSRLEVLRDVGTTYQWDFREADEDEETIAQIIRELNKKEHIDGN